MGNRLLGLFTEINLNKAWFFKKVSMKTPWTANGPRGLQIFLISLGSDQHFYSFRVSMNKSPLFFAVFLRRVILAS
ncbi:hypothetical protein X474_09210 [Dethiosulfatarculus sandiegensis]|uniref:Uncharacterized protein n=1 Tax=Dethiosulfatarculus sandiegensis TaxID=1429043 RepID=A0A0D2GHK3_9BACT|nr:hypothetical protein X474_09210 [Dethiosulfatarculus sandiegensis]